MRNELNRLIGNQNEELALDFLESEDFSIVARNYHARKLGEIDIIAMRDGVLHFVEVKSGQKDFDPIYNFTAAKQRKIINSAYYYMKQHNLDIEFCIDLIVVRWGEVEFLENVTL